MEDVRKMKFKKGDHVVLVRDRKVYIVAHAARRTGQVAIYPAGLGRDPGVDDYIRGVMPNEVTPYRLPTR